MKKRFIIFVLTICCIAIVIFLRIHFFSRTKNNFTINQKSKTQNSSQVQQPALLNSSNHNKYLRAKEAVTNEKKISIVNIWEDQRETDLTFYGRILDQNAQPVVGASIRGFAVSFRPESADKPMHPQQYLETISDGSGYFKIHAGRTRMFTISTITKAGYELALSPTGTYSYDVDKTNPKRHISDNRNPTLFHMWKKGEYEHLIIGNKLFGIQPDGRKYVINLLDGTKTEGNTSGDFTIRINRPLDLTWGRRNYGWSFVLEAVNGGVIEANDIFTYEAPQLGYLPRYEFKINAGDTKWQDSKSSKFYIKTRGSQVYASIELQVFSIYQKSAAVRIKYIANAAGSRNLQYDPLQRP